MGWVAANLLIGEQPPRADGQRQLHRGALGHVRARGTATSTSPPTSRSSGRRCATCWACPELKTDPRFQKRDMRKANRQALTPLLEAKLARAADRGVGGGAQRQRASRRARSSAWRRRSRRRRSRTADDPGRSTSRARRRCSCSTSPRSSRRRRAASRRRRRGCRRHTGGRIAGLGSAEVVRGGETERVGAARRLEPRPSIVTRGARMGMTVVSEDPGAGGRPGRRSRSGDVVEPAVDLAMSHENAALVINQFHEIYQGTGLEPTRVGSVEDRHHLRPPRAGREREDGDQPEEDPRVRRRAGHHEVPRHPRRRGRHLPPDPARERLRAAPAASSWAPTATRRRHGALGAFAFGIGATEMAAVWALGTRPQRRGAGDDQGRRPRRVRRRACTPKDLILHLIGRLSAEGANFKVLEFHGDTIRRMPTSGRLVICNMAVEAGATSGIVPPRRGDGALPARGGRRHGRRSSGRARPRRRVRRRSLEIDVSRARRRRSPARTPWTT